MIEGRDRQLEALRKGFHGDMRHKVRQEEGTVFAEYALQCLICSRTYARGNTLEFPVVKDLFSAISQCAERYSLVTYQEKLAAFRVITRSLEGVWDPRREVPEVSGTL